jgi:hypothetical protein
MLSNQFIAVDVFILWTSMNRGYLGWKVSSICLHHYDNNRYRSAIDG